MFDLGEDGLGAGGPCVGAGAAVVGVDVSVDAVHEALETGEHAAADGVALQVAEPVLDLVEPRARRGRVVHAEPWVRFDPGPDVGVLVRGIVVRDHVHVQPGGHRPVDGPQEPEVLVMPVPVHAFADHASDGHVERGEQRGRAVALVVVMSLKVPKLKGAVSESAVIERYRRREESVEGALIDMYLAGVSTRQVDDVSQLLWGDRMPSQTLSDKLGKVSPTSTNGATGPWGGSMRTCSWTAYGTSAAGEEAWRTRASWPPSASAPTAARRCSPWRRS